MIDLIVLENTRSAYNVGNVIRTCDALGYGVVISGYTPHPSRDPKVAKSALGAEQYISIQSWWNPAETLRQLCQQGYFLIGAETTQESMPLDQVDPLSVNRAQPRAFLFGNEKSGLLAETLQYVDLITHIPMLGTKESLNIGQAAAIYMWAWRR